MADRRGLGILGCIFGSITLAVMATAFIVVLDGFDGSLDGSYASGAAPATVASSPR